MQNAINAIVANLNKGAYSSDSSFIAKQIDKGGEYFANFINQTVQPEQINAMNQKGAKRFAQAVNFAMSGNVKDFDPVTAFMVASIVLTKQSTITFKDAHFLCGIGSDDAQLIKGISKAKLSRFIGGAGNAGTVTSKVSRTTGKGGFFTALGITGKSDKHSFTLTETAKSNALILAYAHQLQNMTEGALALINEKQ